MTKLSYVAGPTTAPLWESTIGSHLRTVATTMPAADALIDRARGHRLSYAELLGAVEELSAAADDPRDALRLSLVERAQDPVAQDLRVRDDRRQRRAEVVRDVREELRLQGVLIAQLRDRPGEPEILLLERRQAAFGREIVRVHAGHERILSLGTSDASPCPARAARL